MTREDLIRSLFEKSSYGLEIGPSYNPIAAKRLGYKVDVLDHATTDDLRTKYASELNIDASLIEDVDFVWSDQTLSETIGKTGAYDYIVASHVIEHTPDFLGFINQCSNLLKPDGRLILAVPDMRRCFDAFRPLTSVGAILDAAQGGRTRHSPGTAFDHVAYLSTLGGSASWGRADTGRFSPTYDLAFAKAIYERSVLSTDYHDFHAWVFTPSSFRLIVSDLHQIDMTELLEVEFLLTDGFEFIAVLAKTGPASCPGRDELILQSRRELSELIEKLSTVVV